MGGQLAFPPEAPLTPEEEERAAMLQRRRIFMMDMRDGNLTVEDIAAAATEAAIFVD